MVVVVGGAVVVVGSAGRSELGRSRRVVDHAVGGGRRVTRAAVLHVDDRVVGLRVDARAVGEFTPLTVLEEVHAGGRVAVGRDVGDVGAVAGLRDLHVEVEESVREGDALGRRVVSRSLQRARVLDGGAVSATRSTRSRRAHRSCSRRLRRAATRRWPAASRGCRPGCCHRRAVPRSRSRRRHRRCRPGEGRAAVQLRRPVALRSWWARAEESSVRRVVRAARSSRAE